MTDEDPKTDPPENEDPKDPPENEDPPEGDPKADPPENPELTRAIKRRDAALKAKQKIEGELAALKEKYEPEKADPVKAAHRQLASAEARAVLASKGITDRDDQRTVTGFLNLEAIEVQDDGTVDGDAIADQLDSLIKVFGKLNGTGRANNPRLNTRDRGGERAKPEDAKVQRHREMLGYK